MNKNETENALFDNMMVLSKGDMEGLVAACTNQIMARVESELDFIPDGDISGALKEHIVKTLKDCDSIANSLHNAIMSVKLVGDSEYQGFHSALDAATGIINTEVQFG